MRATLVAPSRKRPQRNSTPRPNRQIDLAYYLGGVAFVGAVAAPLVPGLVVVASAALVLRPGLLAPPVPVITVLVSADSHYGAATTGQLLPFDLLHHSSDIRRGVRCLAPSIRHHLLPAVQPVQLFTTYHWTYDPNYNPPFWTY